MSALRTAGRALRLRVERLAPGTSDRELALLAAAMALGAAIVVVYLLATRDHPLVGDEPAYHEQGVFFTEGKLWWATAPFGTPHEAMWKAPLYPAWVGLWYEILGPNPLRVELVQAVLLAPLTVALTWLLARRLFGWRVAMVSAFAVAAFPLAWESYALLLPEALAIPLSLLLLLVACRGEPSVGRAAAVGAVLGVNLLVRPSSFFLFAGVAVAWMVTAGPRRGLGRAAVAAVCAALVIVPWTIRNYVVSDGDFVPISLQDAAAYGTFNDQSANDPVRPYGWRPETPEILTVLERAVDDADFRSQAQDLAWDYIGEHPESVPEAFFWNGISRFWDLRRPARSMDEAPFENRTRAAKAAGLVVYYPLLLLAIVGLWLQRRRRAIVYAAMATAVAASIVFTVDASSRYRAPLAAPLVILAASVLAAPSRRHSSPRA